MSKQEAMRKLVRKLVKQQLDAAAEVIMELFENIITDYEKMCCYKKNRQHTMQQAGSKAAPQFSTSDIQQTDILHKWSLTHTVQDPLIQSLKLEQEELSASQDAKHLPKVEEDEWGASRFPVSAVHVKSESTKQTPEEECQGLNAFKIEVGNDEVESLFDSEYETENSQTDDNDGNSWQKSEGAFEAETSSFDRNSRVSPVTKTVLTAGAKTVVDVPENLSKKPSQRAVPYTSGITLDYFLGDKCFGLMQNVESQETVWL